MEQNSQNIPEKIWEWLRRRGRDVTTGFARAYTWVYDLPYEEETTTSDIISAVETGVEPYASVGPFRWLASPASPIDPIYHLAHPSGYQTTLERRPSMEEQRIEDESFRPPAMLPSGGLVLDPGGMDIEVSAQEVEAAVEATELGMATLDPWDYSPTSPPISTIEAPQELVTDLGLDPTGSYNYDPPYTPDPGVTDDPAQTFGGGTTMTLAPFQNGGPGALGVMGRRTLIKTWLAGPPGRRIRFYHFYMGNRKYTGCVKADGSWKQWPTYRPLVIGKTMTDKKARRVANKMDSYMKSVKKIASVLGWKLRR